MVTSGTPAIIALIRCGASCSLCRSLGRSARPVRATVHAPRSRMGGDMQHSAIPPSPSMKLS